MKKGKYLFFISFILYIISFSAFSASDNDSLIDVIKNGNPNQRTSAFYRLANKTKNFEQAISLYDSAEYYYNKYPNDSDLMFLNGFKALTFNRYNQYEKAVNSALIAVKIGIKIDKKKDVAAMYRVISKIYEERHLYDSAIFYMDKAIPLYKSLLDNGEYSENFILDRLAKTHLSIGVNYLNQRRYNHAIEHFYASLKLNDKTNNIEGVASCYLNIGNVYNLNQDYIRANEEYQKGLVFAKITKNENLTNHFITNIGTVFMAEEEYDSALYYFDKSLDYKLSIKNNQYAISGIYNNKALIYKHFKEYNLAIEFFNKAMNLNKEIDNKIAECSIKSNIGLTLIEMGQYIKAKNILLEVLDYSKNNKMGETTKETYMGLSEIYRYQQDYKNAFKYYELYVLYKDSINSVEVSNKLNQYKEQYETEKKDQEIKILEQKATVSKLLQEKQEAQTKRQNIIGILLAIIIIFLIIAMIFIQRYFSLRHIASQELLRKNAEINQQKILDLIKEQEVKSINSFMSGQEKERNRIAAELHDRLGSLLSAVKLHFSSIEADLNEKDFEEKENFSFALNLLDNSVDEVRSISHNLSKGILMQFNIAEAIINLRDTINAAGDLQVKFIEVGPKFKLLPEHEVELFRVIQELITNAIKHSQAKEIFVQLISDKDGLRVLVEDQGVGFNMKKIKTTGLGLLNLKSRIEKIGGEYTIESSIGQGTTIMIELKNRT